MKDIELKEWLGTNSPNQTYKNFLFILAAFALSFGLAKFVF